MRQGNHARSRRHVLRVLGGASLGLLLAPDWGRASTAPTRTLSFYCLHTGEALTAEYCVRGRYQPDCLRAIDHLLRDHRDGEVVRIDPRLLDLLHRVRTTLGSREPYQVVSGHRSLATNAMLRQLDPGGVAAQSYHLTGQAADIYLPDRDLRDLRNVAIAIEAGGVGYYPRSGFVHVDTGPIRRW